MINLSIYFHICIIRLIFVKQQKAEFNYLSDKVPKIFKYLLGMNMENITEKVDFLVISSI